MYNVRTHHDIATNKNDIVKDHKIGNILWIKNQLLNFFYG